MQVESADLTQTTSNNDFEAITKRAAEYVGMTSGYFQAHSVSDMLDDAQRLVRRFPEHSMIAAAAVGLLLGTVLRRR